MYSIAASYFPTLAPVADLITRRTTRHARAPARAPPRRRCAFYARRATITLDADERIVPRSTRIRARTGRRR